MSAANGHAHENGGRMTGPPTALEVPTTPPHSAERVAELVAALEYRLILRRSNSG